MGTSGRRSFLAAVVAWLAALVALVLPRRGLALAPPVRGGFTRPTAPASPGPTTWDCSPYRVPGRVYDDMGRMLDEMHAHLSATGHMVLCCDFPEHRLIGFSTFNARPGEPEDGRLWHSSIGGAKKLIADLDAGRVPDSFGTKEGKDAVGILREVLSSPQGRMRLAAAYYDGSQERYKAGLGPLPSTIA